MVQETGGEPASPLEVSLYAPHAAQMVLHNSTARFRVATCGRRWGKTLACANEIIKAAIDVPSSVCWWVAPVFGQTEIAMSMVERALIPTGLVRRYQKSLNRFILVNESQIEFHSVGNEPDRLRGPGLNCLVIDEAAMMEEKVWTEILRPTLADRNGKLIMISTPKGRNYFHRLFQEGQAGLHGDPKHREWASWNFPSSSNPYLPASEIEDARTKLPRDVFRQEWLAEFLEESAGVFKGIQACIWGPWEGRNEGPQPNRRYVLGWDVAKYTNFSVLTVIDKLMRRVVAWDRFNRVDWSYQIAKVRNLAAYFHANVIMDATGAGDPLVSQVRAALTPLGLALEPIVFTNDLKQQIIENLAISMEQRRVSYPAIPELLQELEVFQYEMTKSRNIIYSAPTGFDDDCVMSLALALWKCNTGVFFESNNPWAEEEQPASQNPQEGWYFDPITRTIKYPESAMSPFRSLGSKRPLF